MREQDKAAVRALEAAYDAAWNAGDVQTLVAAFTPDAVIISPMGKRASGRAEIGRMLRDFLGGAGKGSRHTSVVLGIEFIDDNVALVDGEARLEGLSGPVGSKAVPLVHRFTDVVVKRGGTWAIAQVRAYVFVTSPLP